VIYLIAQAAMLLGQTKIRERPMLFVLLLLYLTSSARITATIVSKALVDQCTT
jgi:hypothetical protein